MDLRPRLRGRTKLPEKKLPKPVEEVSDALEKGALVDEFLASLAKEDELASLSSRERTLATDPVFQDLADEGNVMRVGQLAAEPRLAPDLRFRDSGGEEEPPEPHNEARILPREKKPAKEESTKNQIAPKREEAKPEKSERSAASARIRPSRPNTKLKKRSAPSELGEIEAAGGGGSAYVPSARSLDSHELRLEDPFATGHVDINKSELDLLLDRRLRRQAAEQREERKEREKAEWDYDETPAETGPDRKFSLPIYLIKAALVTIAGLLLVFGSKMAYDGIRGRLNPEPVDDSQAIENQKAVERFKVTSELALKVAERFLAAKTWQERLKIVRNPDVVGPKMERYYRADPSAAGPYRVRKVSGFKHSPLAGGDAFVYSCELRDGSEITVPVVRFPEESDECLVDWESFVGYSDEGWKEFLALRLPGSTGVFRLEGSSDDFYFGPFEDSERHECLLIRDQKELLTAYGYVPRNSKMAGTLREMIAVRRMKEGKELPPEDVKPWLPQPRVWPPMVLKLRFTNPPSKSDIPQLEIMELISPNWIIPPSRGN